MPAAARTAERRRRWTVTPPTLPARPHPRGRPHRGGRAHRRLRHGARDAAAAHHRRRADPAAAGAARRAARPGRLRPRRGHHLQLHRARRARAARPPRGRRAARPGQALQPDERGAVGDAHHAAARPAQDRARQRRPAQRPAEPVRDRQGLPVGRAGPGAGARRRARRRAAARAGGVGIVLSGPLRGRGLDRRRPRHGLLHAQGRRRRRAGAPSACAASTRRSATRRRSSPSCIPARRRS